MTVNARGQAGFEAVGLIVAVLFLAIIGFAGYTVLNMNKDTETKVVQTSSESSVEPDKIENKDDLTDTSKALDQSSADLDKDLDDSKLDTDMNALL